ncbi:MAG: FecCD family ABC transporter permease [bacterium]
MSNIWEGYLSYIKTKVIIIVTISLLTIILAIYAINAGSSGLSPKQVLMTLLGGGDARSYIIVWNIRLPRVLSAIIAGIGLSISGCVVQTILRNPLASPFTLGISQGAAFGVALSVTVLGTGSIRSTSMDAVIINNPYLTTLCAFIGSMGATLIILALARYRRVSPEAMVLAGVAISSLFSALTTVIQYFANEIQVASIVFWTFGDIGRANWRDLEIMTLIVSISTVYFLLNRWNYNALVSGEETAKGLGVAVERLRLISMFIASLVTAVVVSFLGVIGFIGLVGPHMVRRLIGGDHRFLLIGSAIMGGILLLASDTFGRTIIAPVVLPVGAVTSFIGAPVFLYLLIRGYKR